MDVKLIFPRLTDIPDPFSTASSLSNVLRPFWRLGRSNLTPPLSLLMLAAVTPPHVNIQLVDERLEQINFDEKVDLVGITVVTKAAYRAYTIAEEFRKRGVAVVLGGIHPSVLPHEAIQHADAIVIGEGEESWVQILKDFENGCLKRFYSSKLIENLNGLPLPRRDIIPNPEKYLTTKVVAATRGCENTCAFCSNGLAVHKKYRTRNVESVVAEIESVPGDTVIFVDDNLGWNITYAKRLFKALVPLRIKWIGETTICALEDIELVDLMAASGCIALGLGFESISPKTMSAIHKDQTNDPRRYQELVMRAHSYGIPIFGNFIVGFDDDDKSVFRELVEFINDSFIEMPSVNLLVPYPGTPIYKQLENERRLFHKDWSYYDDMPPCVVYQPRQMSAEELIEGYIEVIETIHTLPSFLQRVIGAKTLRLESILLGLLYNQNKRNSVIAGMPKTKQALAKCSPLVCGSERVHNNAI